MAGGDPATAAQVSTIGREFLQPDYRRLAVDAPRVAQGDQPGRLVASRAPQPRPLSSLGRDSFGALWSRRAIRLRRSSERFPSSSTATILTDILVRYPADVALLEDVKPTAGGRAFALFDLPAGGKHDRS